MKVKLIAKTVICDEELANAVGTDPQALLLYCARVSNPNNQTSNDPRLFKYCAKHNHWSIFQMADFVFEIETSRGIAAQILRHKSFDFQEFSQRYSEVSEFENYEARRQDLKNRQNSIDDLSQETKDWFLNVQDSLQRQAYIAYNHALGLGIAKEQARFLLPLSTKTKLYMKGSVRSWIHYVNVRTDPSTQKEHRDIAIAIKNKLIEQLPKLAEALQWEITT